MKVKMCDHIDVSGIRIDSSQAVFSFYTVDENQFVTYSCKQCFNEIKELLKKFYLHLLKNNLIWYIFKLIIIK